MSKNNNYVDLKEKIDKYGMLKAKINELTKETEELNAFFKGNLEVNKIYFGNKYTIKLSERVSPVINPKLVYKKIKNNIFNVVTVVKKELSKYLSEKEIDECIESYKSSIIVEVDNIK